MAQDRVFQITTFNRRGQDPLKLTFCELHGVVFCALNLRLRMHDESRIRTLVREVWPQWGRVRVVARPLREGETIVCDDCEAARESAREESVE